jgi:hypothetical protein
MAKWVVDSVMDAGLGIIQQANLLAICTEQPVSRVGAVSSFGIAMIAVNSASFTYANGGSSGRKITLAAVSSIGVNSSGNANHVALCNSSALLLVTTCTSQGLTQGNSVATPAFADEIADPA